MSLYDRGDTEVLGGVWDAVCDANALLSGVQALAEGVRDRVRGTVAERGGFRCLSAYPATSPTIASCAAWKRSIALSTPFTLSAWG